MVMSYSDGLHPKYENLHYQYESVLMHRRLSPCEVPHQNPAKIDIILLCALESSAVGLSPDFHHQYENLMQH